MNTNLTRTKTTIAILVLAAATAAVQANNPRTPATLSQEVRHEIIMLPYYGVFDLISYEVNGNQVTLSGYVTRPTLKSEAENVVRRIKGVEKVDNRIEVLPLSPMDDRIRLATLRAIYRYPALQRYALQPVAPIRIIVKNGQVTLEGYVDSKMDITLAGMLANGIPGVFHVTNNLQEAREDAKRA